MDLKGSSNNNDDAVSGGYMFLEASGDSEADCKGEFACEILHHMVDEDDALSCSYDESEAGGNLAEIKGWECLNGDDDEEEEEKKKKKKLDGVNYGNSYCEDDEMQEQCHHKSCVSDDSGLDEMEKNRLFWEACLAS